MAELTIDPASIRKALDDFVSDIRVREKTTRKNKDLQFIIDRFLCRMPQSYKVCPGLTARNRSFFAIARLYESPSTIGFPQKKEMPD